jgi:protein SCO1/2
MKRVLQLAWNSVLVVASLGVLADNSRWGANYFPNVVLTTQDGTKVHFYDDLLKGKIVVIDLIYTHCVDSCPLETARLAQVQRMLGDRVGKDIFFYSITLDPKRDTPEVLKDYAQKYGAGPGWLFLTGSKSDIDLISRKLGLYSAAAARTRDGHQPAVLIGNEATGQWIRNSATDNPRFLSIMIGDWLTSWRNRAAAAPSYAQAPQLNIKDKGQYIFATHCAACHSIGHGDTIGPDLQGITEKRSPAWLTRFIQDPDKLLGEKDPVAISLFEKYGQVQMPNLRLAGEDVEAIIQFLHTATPGFSSANDRTNPADAALAPDR